MDKYVTIAMMLEWLLITLVFALTTTITIVQINALLATIKIAKHVQMVELCHV